MPIPSRSKMAQELHTDVMNYIRVTEENEMEAFVTLTMNWLNHADNNPEILKEKSINGYTHLMDALNLPFYSHKGNYKIIQHKIQNLMQLMLSEKTPMDVQRTLLLEPCNEGFTPLHEVLIYGNLENLQIYFDAMDAAITTGSITLEDYKKLLITANRAGFTPFHEAVISGSYNIYAMVKEKIMHEVSEQEFTHILWAKTKMDYLPKCPVTVDKPGHREINQDLMRLRWRHRNFVTKKLSKPPMLLMRGMIDMRVLPDKKLHGTSFDDKNHCRQSCI